MPTPDCLLLDIGNVIVFHDHHRASHRLAELTKGRMNEPEVYDLLFVSGLESQYDRGELTTAAFVSAIRENLDLHVDFELVAQAWADIFWPNDGVTRILPRLRGSGIRLVLASNTNELHYDWLCRQFPEVFRLFDGGALSYCVGARKPEARFFERCLDVAGTAAQRCFYLDDKPEFVEAARALSIPGMVYHPKLNLIEHLQEMGFAV